MQNQILNLNHKVAAVIGASSGIGRATALLLAKQGAAGVLCARRGRVSANGSIDTRSGRQGGDGGGRRAAA